MRGDKAMKCSRPYFNRIWKTARPLIKVTRCGDFMKCSECTEVNVKLHGAPGIQPLQDSHQREVVIAQRRAHQQVRPKNKRREKYRKEFELPLYAHRGGACSRHLRCEV